MANIDIGWMQIRQLNNKTLVEAAANTNEKVSEATQALQEDIANSAEKVTTETAQQIQETASQTIQSAQSYVDRLIDISEDTGYTKLLKDTLTWSAAKGLQIKDTETSAKVQIKSNGMYLFGPDSSEAKAQVTTDYFRTPRTDVEMLSFHNGMYVLEYMSDGSVTLKKV